MADTFTAHAPPTPAPAPGMSASIPPPKPYDAFISYKQATESRLAGVLRDELHAFAKPWYRLRAVRVFLDRYNLDGSPRLWRNIEAAVRSSRYFIYLASPEAKESPWVKQEITQFLLDNPPERLIIVLAAGDIVWDREAKDFDWEKTTAMPRLEAGLITPDTSPLSDTLYHDARWARHRERISSADPDLRDLVATVSSTLRGVPKDLLAGVDVRLRRRALRLAWGAVTMLSLLAVGMGVASWRAVTQQRLAVQRLARFYVANGMRLVDEGDPLSGLPWLAAALEAEPEGAAGAAHRERVAAVLRVTPRLVRRWKLAHPVQDVALDRDGSRMVVVTGSPYDDPRVTTALGDFNPVGYARVYDVKTGRPLTPLLKHRAGISTAAFSPDGTRLLTASADSSVVLWRLRGARTAPDHVLDPGSHVKYAGFSGDGLRVLTLGNNARVWDVTDGRPLGTLPLPEQHRDPTEEPFYSAALDSAGTRVAVRGEDGVWVWSVGAANVRALLGLGGSGLGSVRFTPDGRTVVAAAEMPHPAAGAAQTIPLAVRQVDPASGRRAGPTIEQEDPLTLLELSPDGRKLLTGRGGGLTGTIPHGLRVWDRTKGVPIAEWLDHSREIVSASFSPDGRWVVSLEWPGSARVWAIESGGARDTVGIRLQVPITQGSGITVARMHPDGRHLVTAAGSEVRLWDMVPRGARKAPGVRVPAIAPDPAYTGHSPSGRWIARLGGWVRAGPGSREVIVGEAALGDTGRTLSFSEIIVKLRFTADERLLAIVSEGGSVWVWDLERGAFRLDRALELGTGIEWIEFSPDNRYLAAGGDRMRVWDLRSGEPLTPLIGHGPPTAQSRSVRHMSFSRDGARFATTGSDGTARVWTTAGGEPVTPYLVRSWQRIGLTWFGPDGHTLYGAADEQDTLLLAWSLAPVSRPARDVRRSIGVLSSLRVDETGALVPVDP